MLKKLLATSALIAVGAAFVQSASAADDSKLRQLVVEPAGTHAPDAAGLPTPNAGEAKQFVLKQGGGIPTPTQTADANPDAGASKDKPAKEFVIAPPGGISTPAAGPTADAGAPANAGAPVGVAAGAAGAPPAIAQPPADPAPAAAPPPDAAPATGDAGNGAASGAPVEATPAAPAPAPAVAAVKNPKDLFNLLTDKGFGVEIVKEDGNGDLLYHVTIPGNAKDGYLLTVDGEYGRVLERKYISSYDYSQSFSYHAPTTYAPSYSYSPAYGSDDNCDYASGYNTGY